MSDTGSTHSEVDTTKELTVGFLLTITSKVTVASHAGTTNNSSRGRASTKTNKEIKSKEGPFTFAASLDSYLGFLRLCLSIHKQDDKFKVPSEKEAFKFRYYFTPGRPKASALDIEGLEDYVGMVKALVVAGPTKVAVLIDLLEVEKSHAKRTAALRDGLHSEEEDIAVIETELTRQMARIRKLLESKYGNENDQTFAYTFSDGFKMRLTPVMMMEWCRNIYDAIATVNEPPNTEAFDPLRRRAVLATVARQSAPPTPVSSSTCDLSHLNGILSAVERLVSGAPSSAGQPRTPYTPHRGSRQSANLVTTPLHRTTTTQAIGSSLEPLVYESSDIALFLRFAQKRLGVKNALDYEAVLQEAAFGPDILSKVPALQLTELGIKSGDAVRLRENAEAWWNGEARKSRKRAMQDEDELEPSSSKRPQKQARVYYKTTYTLGGGKRWEGGPLRERRPETIVDSDIESVEYFNEATLKFCPVPSGFVAPNELDCYADDDTQVEN